MQRYTTDEARELAKLWLCTKVVLGEAHCNKRVMQCVMHCRTLVLKMALRDITRHYHTAKKTFNFSLLLIDFFNSFSTNLEED